MRVKFYSNGRVPLLMMLSLLARLNVVNSHNDTRTTVVVASSSTVVTTAADPPPPLTVPPLRLATVKCGDTQKMVDECFNDFPPHLMEFLQTSKIVINELEIASKCTVFNRGMSCFEEYTARCLPHDKDSFLKNNVDGARKFFNKFCGDREFQKDYLQHKDCFTYIQEDWQRCTKTFQDILSEELHVEATNVTHKFMEFCCARSAYENCIYTSARYKCYQHSAKFARDTAKMLSDEKHFSNCRQFEASMCTASGLVINHWPRLLLQLLVVLLLLPRLQHFGAVHWKQSN